MSVMFWDLSLLALFLVFVTIFLIVERKKIQREGLLFLYHTQWGVKFIKKFGEKHEKGLKILSYVSVVTGYILMVLVIYFFAKILYVYIFQANIVRALKIPPITPLIPYLPQIFKLDFLPPFYFSYWIIILAIVAVTHEFFHGIFAKIANVKTKTTGIGFFPFFFPIFLAAFVNLDEKKMEKTDNFKQRAILSAGTFANILTALLGLIFMWLIFTASFSPAGVVYNDYAYGFVNPNAITSVNGINLTNASYETISNLTISGGHNKIVVGNTTFAGVKGVAPNGKVALYYESPAIKNNLTGAITQMGGEKVHNLKELAKIISSYKVGENVTLSMFNGTTTSSKVITLENSPEGKPWIGITFLTPDTSGVINSISAWITSYKNPHIYYSQNFAAAKYIYDLFWWLVLISFSIALVNMLPMGIFDGGRFFYLTILKLTKSKEKAEKSFKFVTALFLALLVVLMFFWAISFF